MRECSRLANLKGVKKTSVPANDNVSLSLSSSFYEAPRSAVDQLCVSVTVNFLEEFQFFSFFYGGVDEEI